jgi:hypothetical protein
MEKYAALDARRSGRAFEVRVKLTEASADAPTETSRAAPATGWIGGHLRHRPVAAMFSFTNARERARRVPNREYFLLRR